MRVLGFTSATDIYSERFLLALRERGHDAALVCSPDRAGIVHARTPALPIHALAPARSRLDRATIHLYRGAIASFAPDVAVVYTSRVLSLVRVAASASPRLAIVGSRGALSGVSLFNPPDWFTYLSPRVDAIVCMSRAIEEALRAVVHWPLGRLGERFTTIYQGYDLLLERGPQDERLPADVDPLRQGSAPVCVCIGNDRPIKGYRQLLDAIALLPDTLPLSLVMIGRLEPATRERIRSDSRLSRRVRALGYLPNARAALAQADFYVQPTQAPGEGIGNAIAEAMSHSLAVITGNVGGSTELVKHGDNGLQVDTASAQAIADALARLAADPGLRVRMGERGRERLRDTFSMRACVDAHLALFERVLARRARLH